MAYKIDPKTDRMGRRVQKTADRAAQPAAAARAEFLRYGPLAGRYVLICTRPYRQWVLARHPGERGEPFGMLDEHRFSSREEAEWAVFHLRWRSIPART